MVEVIRYKLRIFDSTIAGLVEVFVIINVQETYVEKDEPWTGNLANTDFTIHFTANILKGYTLGKLIFFHNIIVPIKNNKYWE